MKLKSFIASVVAFAICMSTVATTALAAVPVHDNVQSVYSGDGYHAEYSMSGQNVVEHSHFTFSDSSTLEVTRTIRPNGTMSTTMIVNNDEVITKRGTGDYESFYNLYRIQNIPSVSPFGSEITGSQFKHVYVGNAGTTQISVAALESCKDAATLASIILPFINQPAAAVSSLAVFIFDKMTSGLAIGCDTIKISADTHEVHFVADNNYYMHCYHQTVCECKGNTVLRSETDYYQAIGG